ncbi:hypothetical protein BGZ80_002560 [Entomortierella chlamydospora]|uniref:Uncharacterized protein n=1 Tax=Entomortierella chlamydospora TaxID=101097 RepID=A0A9P6MPP4_9FUNG|nr:hypothetical protein BGZ79_001498 [Entomortierella chlamydospora]KAG0009270.1 hypothetical protein BGZ80_002560 [Entomortierella chlamydospora]
MTAMQEFPESDSIKGYFESTSISSFILPLCMVFMGMPSQRVFLNFIDSTTESERSHSDSSNREEPDLALEIKDGSNRTLCEVGVEEVISPAQKNLRNKNTKDLVRIGLSLKNALDFIEDRYGVQLFMMPFLLAGKSSAKSWRYTSCSSVGICTSLPMYAM